MRNGQVSRTALNVAAAMVTLGADSRWHERLPAGLPELSEALLLAADQYPFTERALRLSRQPWAVGLAQLGERFQPGVFEGIGRRKIFMDEQVCAAIDDGAGQVLVVGAGFDTLGLRLAAEYPGLEFLEIDHPATAAVKRSAVKRLGCPGNLSFVAADLARRKLSDVLEGCGSWESQRRSAVVAEGLLYYLPPAAVRELFAQLYIGTPIGSRVVFSHLPNLYRYRMAQVALRLGGEPWLSASSSARLPDYIGPGWQVLTAVPARPFRDLEGLAVVERL